MEDKKITRSVRANPEIFDRLKSLCNEKGLDQGAAMEALLNAWDIQEAKGLVPERAADVADFDAHVQGLQSAFLRSLDLARSAEQRARISYATQLDALAGTVARLEKELEKLKQKLENAEETADKLREKLEESGRARFHAEKRVKELERIEAALDRFLGINETDEKPESAEPEKEPESEGELLTADFAREELRKNAISKARKAGKKTATVKTNGESATYSAETGKLIQMNITKTKATEINV